MNFLKDSNYWFGQFTFFLRRLIAKIPKGIVRNWLKSGPYIEERFANGQRKVLRHYRYGRCHGLTILWYSNGRQFAQGNYQNGREEGVWEEWCENGVKRKKGAIGQVNWMGFGVNGWQTVSS